MRQSSTYRIIQQASHSTKVFYSKVFLHFRFNFMPLPISYFDDSRTAAFAQICRPLLWFTGYKARNHGLAYSMDVGLTVEMLLFIVPITAIAVVVFPITAIAAVG